MLFIKIKFGMCATAKLGKKKVISGWEWRRIQHERSDFSLEGDAQSSKKTINFQPEGVVEPARIKQFPAGKLHHSGWK